MAGRKDFEAARNWWLARAEEFAKLPTTEQVTVAYRYGLRDLKPHTIEQVAYVFGVSPQSIGNRLRHARVRADRELLLKAGVAMQLVTDYDVDDLDHAGLPTFTDRAVLSLRYQQLNTLNDLLDKSAKWLVLVGMTQPIATRFRLQLATVGFYLRSEVPSSARQRTPLSHTISSR